MAAVEAAAADTGGVPTLIPRRERARLSGLDAPTEPLAMSRSRELEGVDAPLVLRAPRMATRAMPLPALSLC